mgnify:CR=1 FL=1
MRQISEGKHVLAIEHLSCSYGHTDVFRDVSMFLDPGDICVLRGVNGAGKSTLLRCIAGRQLFSSGVIRLDGKDASKGTDSDAVIFVEDTPSFYEDLTAREHIRFALRLKGLDDAEKHAEELAGAFDLRGSLDSFPSSFSRGMRYKLALVIAFSLDPTLLLLDEPYGPIDKKAATALDSLIEEYAQRGRSVLLSCHQGAEGLHPTVDAFLEEGSLQVVRP